METVCYCLKSFSCKNTRNKWVVKERTFCFSILPIWLPL
jgi:hypothetical protein